MLAPKGVQPPPESASDMRFILPAALSRTNPPRSSGCSRVLRCAFYRPFALTLVAASGTAASLGRGAGWFCCPHECTHKFSVHLRGDRVHVNALSSKKVARIFGAVNARWLNVDLPESCRRELISVFNIFKCARHTADPQENAVPDYGSDFTSRDNVGNCKPAARLEYAERFSQDFIFIR